MKNKEFVHKNETLILQMLLKYIPDVLREETDDLSQFIRRMLIVGLGEIDLDAQFHGDSNRFARDILVNCGLVDLRKPYEKETMIFTPNGDIKKTKMVMPQVGVYWEERNHKLHCYVVFPDTPAPEEVAVYDI